MRQVLQKAVVYEALPFLSGDDQLHGILAMIDHFEKSDPDCRRFNSHASFSTLLSFDDIILPILICSKQYIAYSVTILQFS
jgi:hypothetical protein